MHSKDFSSFLFIILFSFATYLFLFQTRNRSINNLYKRILNFDDRFQKMQPNFIPKSFFPILEYFNVSQIQREKKEGRNLFYINHVAFNYPFVLRGGAQTWPAFEKWRNQTYLCSKIGNKTISLERKEKGNKEFAYFTKGFEKIKMKYEEFIKIYNGQKEESQKWNFYWAEGKIPKELKEDVKEFQFAKFMNLEDINLWQVIIFQFLFFFISKLIF